MPFAIYILGLTIFSITTSEFMVAGMMPSLVNALNVSVAEVGYLISLYAAGMVFGGPVLIVLFLKLKIPNKNSLLWLLVFYTVAQSIAAVSKTYEVMMLARIATGIAGSACFGVALSMCANLVSTEFMGRAGSIVMGGLMLASVLGVPIAMLIDQHLGWRASFWFVVILTILSMLLIIFLIPKETQTETINFSTELLELKNTHLWAAYTTSALIIGATFAAFSYFSPILIEVTGFTPASVPWILGFYGMANVVGNTVIGRYADQYTFKIMLYGLIILSVTLLLFALFPQYKFMSIFFILIIGLVGVSMNPAMIARVMKSARPSTLVNTVHASIINIGLFVGSWVGGVSISLGYGIHSPLWVGMILAVLGLISLLPYIKNYSSTQMPIMSSHSSV